MSTQEITPTWIVTAFDHDLLQALGTVKLTRGKGNVIVARTDVENGVVAASGTSLRSALQALLFKLHVGQ